METTQDTLTKRPYGITAISVLLLAFGAQITGLAILNLSMDMSFLASPGGSTLRYLLFAYIFAGLSTAGIGIALYEGLEWARTASLFVFAFFTTLKLFSLLSQPLRGSLFVLGVGFCLVCVSSILYLSMPEARHFLGLPLKKRWEAPMEPAGALQRAL